MQIHIQNYLPSLLQRLGEEIEREIDANTYTKLSPQPPAAPGGGDREGDRCKYIYKIIFPASYSIWGRRDRWRERIDANIHTKLDSSVMVRIEIVPRIEASV